MTLVQKQRLIGAALLVLVISVIAWFLLASVAKNDIEDIVQKPIAFDSVIEPIDDEPEAEEPTAEIAADFVDESENLAEKDTSFPEKQDTAPAPSPAPAPAPAPVPVPKADKNESLWVLQLASFGVRDNADALSKELETMGYNPMIEILKTSGKPIYRVRLQPVADRAKLEETAKILNNKLKLSTQILQY